MLFNPLEQQLADLIAVAVPHHDVVVAPDPRLRDAIGERALGKLGQREISGIAAGGINLKTGFRCKCVISLHWNRHSIVHMSLKPARDELCNLQTILFQHHHMTGAVYAVVFEAHVFVGDAGLGKVLRCAVVPRSVKRCFAADD